MSKKIAGFITCTLSIALITIKVTSLPVNDEQDFSKICNDVGECKPSFQGRNKDSLIPINTYSGNPQTLKCEVKGNPTPNITWYKDDIDLRKNISMWRKNFQLEEGGNYTCQVCNKMGCIYRSYIVNVTRFPLIIEPLVNATKKVGESIIFECVLRKSSEGGYETDWYALPETTIDPDKGLTDQQKNDLNFTRGEKYEIAHVTLEHSGQYCCHKHNANTNGTRCAYLQVIPNDEIHYFTFWEIFICSSIVVLFVVFALGFYPTFKRNCFDSDLKDVVEEKEIVVVKNKADDLGGSFSFKITTALLRRNPCDNSQSSKIIKLPHYETLEFSREKVSILKKIGEGNSGVVHKAMADGIIRENVITTVAAKIPHDSSNLESAIEFCRELEIMKLVGPHKNIIRLLGYCSGDEIMILTEYAAYGNLLKFFQNYRSEANSNNYVLLANQMPESKLLRFALQIAEAMEYLTKKKCVHRDLAARNVLVTEDCVMKLSDFGLARDRDYYHANAMKGMPVKWMAPESLLHFRFTSASDVWSFGIVLWEIMSLGENPYPNWDQKKLNFLLENLRNDERMGRPTKSSQKTYNLMRDCWSYLPAERPTFTQIVQRLSDLIHITELIESEGANLNHQSCSSENEEEENLEESFACDLALSYQELLKNDTF